MMKHPALARVFSVVLAILAALLLYSGVKGFGKAADENAERLAYEKKFSERIENFRSLRAELENSADYNEVMAALDTFLTAHEKAASKHKTDTAIFSSTKGGLKMGEDMIVATRAQMNQLKEQLRDASSRRAFLEGLLTELIASQKSSMPWLDALANQAAQYALECYMESTKIELVSQELRALMENEPTPESVRAAPYNPPEPPVEMYLPGFPNLSSMTFEDMQSAYQSTQAAYLDAASAYMQAAEAYTDQMQAYYDASQQQTMARFSGSGTGIPAAVSDASVSAEYQLAHSLWEEECRTVKKQLDFYRLRDTLRQLSSALRGIVRQANNLSGSLAIELGGIFPGFEDLAALAESTAARLDRMGSADLSSLSNEEFLDLADDVQEIFDLLTDAFSAIASNLDNPASLIAELMDRLNITGELVKALNQMLDKADQQMQAALEELWYQLGETEKDAVKLEAEKLGLDREAELLTKRTLEADELKDLRNRHAKARLLLLNVPEIKEVTADDAVLADNARAWLDTYTQETEKLRLEKLLINILCVVGGALGVLGIPAAYELIRSRFLLIAPVLLCLACSAGAEALNAALLHEQQYVALFTAIFALLQLLIVLPKAKKPRYAPRH